ncbi:hypothetical protein TNCV_1581141 [Trichonephila clavipes]|nr:hypothetical protein TNCV_1581141 [Trichonephila clavipes]
MTVARLQRKANLKASSNVVPQYWNFKRKYSQDKGGMRKLAWELPDFINRIVILKGRQLLRKTENRKTTKVKVQKRVRLNLKHTSPEVGKPIDENSACVEVGKPIDENPACVEVGTNSVNNPPV